MQAGPFTCLDKYRLAKTMKALRERTYAFTVPVSVLTRFLVSLLAFTRRCVSLFILSMNVGRTKRRDKETSQLRVAFNARLKDQVNRGFENSKILERVPDFLKTSTKHADGTLKKRSAGVSTPKLLATSEKAEMKSSSCDALRLWSPAINVDKWTKNIASTVVREKS